MIGWRGPTLAMVPAFALLIALGWWQIGRKAEKEALLAAIATRASGPAIALWPEPMWQSLVAEEIIFQKVAIEGQFHTEPTLRLYALRDTDPGRTLPEAGWYVLTPFEVHGGGLVLVNRGFVGINQPSPPPPGSRLKLEAFVRPNETPSLFSAADNPIANAWYTRDSRAMAVKQSLPPVAPFTLDQITPNPSGVPDARVKPASLPNRHLEYALTWFSLALTLLGVWAVFVAGRLKRRPG